MRWRALAIISLVANLALVIGWVGYSRLVEPQPADKLREIALSSPHTNIVIRRQPFSWTEIESPDYAIYIGNLRFIGCPEQTIRDIIIADVNAAFASRLAREVVSAEAQWWRVETDPEVDRAAMQKADAIDKERVTLLTNLLGPGWDAGDMISLPRPTHRGMILDGPILGKLSNETKRAIQEIHARFQEQLDQYVERKMQAGEVPDPAEFTRAAKQEREELGRVLASHELEEYLLRYSQTASTLRDRFGELKFFSPTADEFRAAFRATEALDERIAAITGDDPNSVGARASLELQREEALRLSLGSARYEEYRRLQDPLYREAMETALETGKPEFAQVIYMANLAAEQEHRALTNSNLAPSQKALAQKQLELEHLTASTIATGQQTLPEPDSPAPRPTVTHRHTVRPGDNESRIAAFYRIPIGALLEANPRMNFGRLRVGDLVSIPIIEYPPIPSR